MGKIGKSQTRGTKTERSIKIRRDVRRNALLVKGSIGYRLAPKDGGTAALFEICFSPSESFKRKTLSVRVGADMAKAIDGSIRDLLADILALDPSDDAVGALKDGELDNTTTR